ncbi:MAG: transposase [Bacteroidales bacterium]|nr:transposase [Bacteroidales bacterium]
MIIKKAGGTMHLVVFRKAIKARSRPMAIMCTNIITLDKKVTHLACWAHARRKFEKALENDRKRAEHAMTQIQKLYAIEREAKDLTPRGRKELRLEEGLAYHQRPG